MKAQVLKNGTVVEHKETLLIGEILMYSGRNLFDFYEVEWIDGSKSFIARHLITKTKLKKVSS